MGREHKILPGKLHLVTYLLHSELYLNRLKRHEIMMVLDEGQYYGVSLCEERVSIKLDIILDKNLEDSLEHRKQLVEFFQSKFDQLCKELIPASEKPKVCIPCPFCKNPHIKYKDHPGGVFCKTQKKTVPRNYYQDLMIYQGT